MFITFAYGLLECPYELALMDDTVLLTTKDGVESKIKIEFCDINGIVINDSKTKFTKGNTVCNDMVIC